MLQAALHILNVKAIEVAIFLFDELMDNGDFYNDELLLKQITDYVAEQKPNSNKQWDLKKHDDTLLEPEDFDKNDIHIKSYDN